MLDPLSDTQALRLYKASMYFNSIFLVCIFLPSDWSNDFLVQGIACLVHLIFTWTGPSPAVQVDLVQGIHFTLIYTDGL